MGLNRGNSFKFKGREVRSYMRSGVHEIKGKFWIIRHYIKGYYRTLEGKFKTKEEAEKAYSKWLKINTK